MYVQSRDNKQAPVVESADTTDLKSVAIKREGSSPFGSTIRKGTEKEYSFCAFFIKNKIWLTAYKIYVII